VRHRDTLYNIARTAEDSERYDVALEHYDLLLDRHPDDPEREVIEERIRRLRRRVTPEPAPAPPDEPVRSFGEEPEEPPSETEPEPTVRESRERRSTTRTMAWVTLALGLASGVAGSIIIGVAASENTLYMERRDELGWSYDQLLASHEHGRALESAGWPLLGIGVASLVASLVLFLVPGRGNPRDDDDSFD